MSNKKPYMMLNTFMVRDEYLDKDMSEFVDSTYAKRYELLDRHGIDGALYIKKPFENNPKWKGFVEGLIEGSLGELSNKSSSAVLFVRSKEKETIVAFTFGYGRFLLDTKYFVQDYGIRTALNTLSHDSLRGVDLYTLEDQAVQKKAQASRESSVEVFGIDVSRDVLRSVTGSPKNGVGFRNISGGDAVFSFGIEFDPEDITEIANRLAEYYRDNSYQKNFSWVDNIRRIKERSEIDNLDEKLLEAIKSKSSKVVVSIPEIAQWDSIYGFSFTRSKNKVTPVLDAKHYLDNLDINSVSIETIKRDKLYVHDVHEQEVGYSLYKCLYFEDPSQAKNHILFAGIWYEVDSLFKNRVERSLNSLPIGNLSFPQVHTWKEGGKQKVEKEKDYNERAEKECKYHLLDRKLVKSNKTTTSIELCDLMTDNRELIHVKHRKGGSSGLSHLFAQGNISAEIMLGDEEFRKKARQVLAKVSPGLEKALPLKDFKSEDFQVVFLILGEGNQTIKTNLPFFSKVNLVKTYENLTQRGYKVSIQGAELKHV